MAQNLRRRSGPGRVRSSAREIRRASTRRRRDPASLETTHALALAAAGIALALIGVVIDVLMHRADAHLASHETPLALGNLSHLLLVSGFCTIVLGVGGAVTLLGRDRGSRALGRSGVVLILASVLVAVPALYLDNASSPEHVDGSGAHDEGSP